jgi:hypothetical protein
MASKSGTCGLARPVTVPRPRGDPVEVSQRELAADDPAALAQAIRDRFDPSSV